MRKRPPARAAVFLACAAAVLGTTPEAHPQSLAINGPGARARGLGGAVLALVDDDSAVFWNPSGLAWADRSAFCLSLDASSSWDVLRLSPASRGDGSATDLVSRASFGNVSGSGTVVFRMGKRWAAGLGIFSPAAARTSWNGSDLSPLAAGRSDIRWSSRASLATLSPAVACKVTDRLTLGIAVLLDFGRFDYSRFMGVFLAPSPEPPYSQEIDLGQYEESSSGWGVGATLGAQYRLSRAIGFGAVVRLPNVLFLRGRATAEGFSELSAVLQRPIDPTVDLRKSFAWPLTLGLGMAVRPLEALAVTADVEWTAWSSLAAIQTDYQSAAWTSYMGERGNDVMPMFARNVLRLKLGAEARWAAWDLRAGLSTNPSPAPAGSINPAFPNGSTVAASLGAGRSFRDWRVDGYLAVKTPTAFADGPIPGPGQAPAAGTIWNLQLLGRYEKKAVSLGLSISRMF